MRNLGSLVVVLAALIAAPAATEASEIVPSEGFELFSHETRAIDRDDPAAGSVTIYVESSQYKVRTRVWIQNDSDYWLSVDWVKVCFGL